MQRSDFGHISIHPNFSLVELPAKLPQQTVKALENTRISGVLINLQPDRAQERRVVVTRRNRAGNTPNDRLA